MSEEIKRIKEAIKNSKLSYMELERITGVSHSTLQRYMNGKTNRIPLSAIAKIAAVAGVTPSYLMGWDKATTPYDRIRMLREEQGLSQQALAEKVGLKTASAINKIELGLRDINRTKIIAFSKALNTTPSYLMGWDEQPILLEHDNEKNKLIDKLIKITRSLSSEQIKVLITVAENISGNISSVE